MKHEKGITILIASLLAFAAAWGTVGCLVTAFDLTLEQPELPALVCGLSALLCAALFSVRHGSILLLCLLALTGGYLYQDGTAARQLWHLIWHLTSIYDRAYGYGVLMITSHAHEPLASDLPLCILGCIIAMTTARCIVKSKTVWSPVLVILLPLCSCIVVTDTVPSELCLLTVMACLVLLILTASLRRENPAQGLRLTAAAALPVVLALGGLFLSFPQQDYVNHSDVLRQNILIAAQNAPQLVESGMTRLTAAIQKETPKQVDLASIGARIPFTYPVLEVTAEQSGTLYLRQQDYDDYTGLGWRSTANRTELFPSPVGQTETILLHSKTRKDFYFLPYYPALETTLTDGSEKNPDQEQSYTILRHHLPEDWRQTAYNNAASSPEEWQQYCSLPEGTRQEAALLLKGLYSDTASNTEKADCIAALVINSASYDLRPPKMPASEPDFALWFLNESDTGYCVHFATAATVLLRAAGVPARYVTGYMTDTIAGETVAVTEEDAHAWAEYYEPNLGLWLPLEATPADMVPESTEIRQPAADPTVPSTEAPAIADNTATPTDPSASAPLPEDADSPPESPEPTEERNPLSMVLLLIPASLPVLGILRRIRLALRRKRQQSGSPNAQALYRWREAERLSHLLKQIPPEDLITLAQKAKFSQYELTEEELQQFDNYHRTCLRRLQEKPFHLQLIYRFIYAAY